MQKKMRKNKNKISPLPQKIIFFKAKLYTLICPKAITKLPPDPNPLTLIQRPAKLFYK